jgi:SAM-dependent methyltransferase/glycosyltransferase involved in cell wall biosynthesis
MENKNIPSEPLPWTGERYLPDIHGSVELEHLHRYLFAEQLTVDKYILDIASGEGYGSAMLARNAAGVIGVDISDQAVLHAKEKYKADNLEFRVGSCAAIPLVDNCVDVVVSFETIEHHFEHEAMMLEIKRVLKPGGLLIISCPDKLEYSDKPAYNNIYHVKELYRDEFESLISSHFCKHIIFGQRAAYGSLILQEGEKCLSETYQIADKSLEATPGLSNAVYLIAIATDSVIPSVKVGLLDQEFLKINEIVERDVAIENLTETIQSLIVDRDSRLTEVIEIQKSTLRIENEHNSANETLRQTIESLIIDRDSNKVSAQNFQDSLTKCLRERDDSVSQLNTVVAECNAEIKKYTKELDEIFSSKSWRITSPMRWLARKIIGGSNIISSNSSSNSQKISDDNCTLTKDQYTKKILLVSHYCPTKAHAGGLRILDIYSLIREQCPDVQIDLLTFHRPSIDWSMDEVYRIFHNVYLSPKEQLSPEAISALGVQQVHYDVIDLQFHQSGHQIDAFRKIGGKIIFTPMESLSKAALTNLKADCLTVNPSRLFKIAGSLRSAAEEVVFALKADEVICVSRSDAAFLRTLTSSKSVRGMDTGVSQFEFSEALSPNYVCTTAENRRCSILYVAYFGSETNVLALHWYLEHVHPKIKARVPNYVLTVVGRGDMSSFCNYNDSSIEFVGEVEALAPHIQQARLGIAPALAGSGFRGKVNQYSVFGVPSVVSPIAYKGLAYCEGENIFIAEQPEVFAERCVSLLSDLELNDRMGQSARKLCLARYSWQSKWPTICEIYQLNKDCVYE